MPVQGSFIELWYERYVTNSCVASYESRCASLIVSRNALQLQLTSEEYNLTRLNGSRTVVRHLRSSIAALDQAVDRLNRLEYESWPPRSPLRRHNEVSHDGSDTDHSYQSTQGRDSPLPEIDQVDPHPAVAVQAAPSPQRRVANPAPLAELERGDLLRPAAEVPAGPAALRGFNPAEDFLARIGQEP